MFRTSSYYFIALLGLAVLGFWDSYFSKLLDGVSGYFHFHAVVMLLWLGLLIVQPRLIRRQRLTVHRALGKASLVLVPLIVVSVLLLAHAGMDKQASEVAEFRCYVLFIQGQALLAFCVAYILAMIYRRRVELHARFMICTALTMIDPALVRTLGVYLPRPPFSAQLLTYGVTDVILVVLIVAERKHERGRLAFPLMLTLFVGLHALNFWVTSSSMWRHACQWFFELGLT